MGQTARQCSIYTVLVLCPAGLPGTCVPARGWIGLGLRCGIADSANSQSQKALLFRLFKPPKARSFAGTSFCCGAAQSGYLPLQWGLSLEGRLGQFVPPSIRPTGGRRQKQQFQ